MLPLPVLTAKLLAIAAAAAIAVTAIASAVAYNRGKAADRQRSDLVIKTMQLDAADRLAAANAQARATSDKLQADKEGAERDLQTERARAARRAADAVATDRIVREQVATFASAPRTGADSVAAAVGRAEALGLVLGESLQLQNELAAAAESESSNVRALRAAWPVIP